MTQKGKRSEIKLIGINLIFLSKNLLLRFTNKNNFQNPPTFSLPRERKFLKIGGVKMRMKV